MKGHAEAVTELHGLDGDTRLRMSDVVEKSIRAQSNQPEPRAELLRAIRAALGGSVTGGRAAVALDDDTRDEFGGPASMARMNATVARCEALMAQGYGEEEACAMVKAKNLKAGDGASE